jgi:hypothetical protein
VNLIWYSTFTTFFISLICRHYSHRQGQVYAILKEIFLAGEIEETSKDVVLLQLEELEKLE